MLSAVILTRDNASTIGATIRQLHEVAGEVLVMDDGSADDTRLVAQRAGAVVIQHAVSSDYAAARNLAMQEARGDWTLYIDSDEILDMGLHQALLALDLDASVYACYRLRRVDLFWGRRISRGEVWTAAHTGLIRLVHRTKGEWRGRVHESFIPTGLVGTLPGYINHHPHQTITSFLMDINHYSTLRAAELQGKMTKKKAFSQLVVYPFGKFMYTYFIRLGFTDGAAGYVYSFMMSFHSFLVRAKVLTA